MRNDDLKFKQHLKSLKEPIRRPTYREIALKRDREAWRLAARIKLRKAQEKFKLPETQQSTLEDLQK